MTGHRPAVVVLAAAAPLLACATPEATRRLLLHPSRLATTSPW